jgi:putative methyltransferase (TIGR04325 family)
MIIFLNLPFNIYRSIKHKILKIPAIKQWEERHKKQTYEKRFSEKCYGCCRGVFNTFEEAIASAPKTKNLGYDSSELAENYLQKLKKHFLTDNSVSINSYDYPIIFWLQNILQINDVVFDLGGNLGFHFYAYAKYLNYPSQFKWLICEMPEIVKCGREFALEKQKSQLFFTSNFPEIEEANILIASGSIQYIQTFWENFSKLTQKPKHILINRLPLYDGKTIVTLQNGGKVFYPQYVFNKQDFIKFFENIGYELIDIWEDRVDSCQIPFYPENSLNFYTGLYLRASFP